MEPPPAAIMMGNTARHRWNSESTLTAKTRSQSVLGDSRGAPRRLMPALLTKTSIRPDSR